jgi:hypothetical protein
LPSRSRIRATAYGTTLGYRTQNLPLDTKVPGGMGRPAWLGRNMSMKLTVLVRIGRWRLFVSLGR